MTPSGPSDAEGGPPLVVREVQLREEPPDLVAACRLEGAGLDLPATYWLRCPAAYGSAVLAGGDAFLPVALLVAMRYRRRLVFEPSVSAALLAATPRIMALYRDWSAAGPVPLHPVEITATPAVRPRCGTASGAFFSCGVDSFYSLLRNVARYPETDARAIRYLVVVHGFDIWGHHPPALFETTRANTAAVAHALGRAILPVATNVRELVSGLDWGAVAHGAGLASVGLLFGQLFHTIYVPATTALARLYIKPLGSHPALDPLWSTEAVEVVHDGAETRRIEKVRAIAASTLALQYLRVCWENRGGAYNCAQCGKCMRTMVDLELAGALKRAETFPHAVDLHAIEWLYRPPGRGGREAWLDTLSEARRLDRQDLVEAIELMLGRNAWAVSRMGRLEGAARRALARVGVTSTALKTLDRRLLLGAGTRIVRNLQRRRGR